MKKYLVSAGLLSLLVSCSQKSNSDHQLKNIGERRYVGVFEGYDKFKGTHLGNACVTYGKPIKALLPNRGTVEFKTNMDASSLAKTFFGKMDGKLDIDEISGKLAVDLLNGHSSSTTSSTISFYVNLSNGEMTPFYDDDLNKPAQGVYLTEYGQAVYNAMAKLSDSGLKADDLWRESCGTDFVKTTKFGAFVIGSVKIDWKSEEAKRRFDGFAEGKYADMGQIKGTLAQFFEKSSEEAAISVSLTMNGGNALELAELMPDKNVLKCRVSAVKIGDDGKVESNGDGGGFDKCLDAVGSMYDKVVKFRDLFDTKMGFTQGATGTTDIGAIDVSLFDFYEATYGSYSSILQADKTTLADKLAVLKLSSDDEQSIAEARKLLGAVYQDTLQVIERAERVLELDPTVDEERKDAIRQYQTMAASKLRRLATARGRCYSASLAVNALPCVSDLKYFENSEAVENDYPLIAGRKVLEPSGEGFIPWCTAFNLRMASSGRQKQISLSNESARTMRAALQALYGDAVPVIDLKGTGTSKILTKSVAEIQTIEEAVAPNDAITDYKLNCEAIEGKVRTTDELNLSLAKGASTDRTVGAIDPLLAFANLSVLKLSGQGIDEGKIEKIGRLENLTHLDLSSNGLRNVVGLKAGFFNLIDLNLSNNALNRFDFVKKTTAAESEELPLQYLEKLDLSKNVNMTRVEVGALSWLDQLNLSENNKLSKASITQIINDTTRNVQLNLSLSGLMFLPAGFDEICKTNNSVAIVSCISAQ